MLFPRHMLRRSRPRQMLMRVVDAGGAGLTEAKRRDHRSGPAAGGIGVSQHAGVHLQCPACGHDEGWVEGLTVTESRRQPCPKCNSSSRPGGGLTQGDNR